MSVFYVYKGALLLAVHDSALFELPEQEHASFDEKNFPSEQTDQYKSVPFGKSFFCRAVSAF